MVSSWQTITLEEFAQHQKGFAFKSKDYVEKGIAVVRVSNLTTNSIDISDLKYVSEEVASDKRNFKLTQNDIVIATVGSWPKNPASVVGKVIKVPKNCDNFLLNQNAVRFRVKSEDPYDQLFLYYLLKSKTFSDYIISTAQGSANQASITLKDIYAFEFKCPSASERKEIANILSAIDDKTSLNSHTNQTLEQMAQALFKSWFVDFDPVIDNALAAGNDIPEALKHKAEQRAIYKEKAQQLPDFKPLPDDTRALFPSEFEQTDEPNIGVAGWIPKGWSISNIEKCCSHIIDHRGKTPKKLGGDWSDSGFAAISAKNVKGGQIVRPDTIRFVDDDLYKKWMKEPLQPKDIIMTSEAPMGEMYFLAEKADYLLSQRLFAMRADIEVTTGEYLNYWLQTTTARADLEGRATGTTVTGIRQVELKKVIVLLPALSTVNKFSKIVEGFLVRKEHNRNQNSNLEDIRDYLLPKLISGEIKLGKVD